MYSWAQNNIVYVALSCCFSLRGRYLFSFTEKYRFLQLSENVLSESEKVLGNQGVQYELVTLHPQWRFMTG